MLILVIIRAYRIDTNCDQIIATFGYESQFT